MISFTNYCLCVVDSMSERFKKNEPVHKKITMDLFNGEFQFFFYKDGHLEFHFIIFFFFSIVLPKISILFPN